MSRKMPTFFSRLIMKVPFLAWEIIFCDMHHLVYILCGKTEKKEKKVR
jgi:hypothetical protein